MNFSQSTFCPKKLTAHSKRNKTSRLAQTVLDCRCPQRDHKGNCIRVSEVPMKKTISKNQAVPGWAKRIETLRVGLGMSQAQLGEELQYSAMAISRWERGIQEPLADAYIKLGKLAAGQERWHFWEGAGLTKTDIQNEIALPRGAFSDVEVVLAGSGAKKGVMQKAQLVAIPLLQVHAGSHGEEGDHVLDLSQSPREEAIAAPVSWCPNPEST